MRNYFTSALAGLTLLTGSFVGIDKASAQSSAIELTQRPVTSVVKQGDILPLVRKDNGIVTLYQVPLSLLQNGVSDTKAWHLSDNMSGASITLGSSDPTSIGTLFTSIQNTLTSLQTNTVAKTGGTSNNQTLNSPTINGGSITNIDISSDWMSPTMTAGQGAAAITANTTGLANEINRAKNKEALLAPISSPTFTDSPTAPTPSQGDGSTRLATTAYTDTAVSMEKSRAQAAELLAAPITSPVFKVSASVGSAAATAPMYIDGPAASARSVVFRTDGTTNNSYRWALSTSADAESGANAGSDFSLLRYNDSGVAIDAPVKVSRATGLMTLTRTPTFPTAAAGDSSTSGATTAFVGAAVLAEQTRAKGVEATLAPLNSPAFTGKVTGPTVAAGNNSSNLATTAYADAGSATTLSQAKAYADAAVRTETTNRTRAESAFAPLASPSLTGTPTAPTPAALDNSTKLATTAYADKAVAIQDARRLASEANLAPLASPVFSGTPTVPNPTDIPGAGSTKIPNTSWVDNNYLPKGNFITTNTTWTVCASGCTYSKVEDAWNAANITSCINGAILTVQIADGTYHIPSTLVFSNPFGNSIRFVGNSAHPENVVFTYTLTSNTIIGIYITDGTTLNTIQGISIISPSDGSGAQKAGNTWTSANLNSTAWNSTNATGISVGRSSTIVTLTNVNINGWYTGVHQSANSFVSITNSAMSKDGFGVTLSSARIVATNLMISNISAGSGYGVGIKFDGSSSGEIRQTTIQNAYNGLFVNDHSYAFMTGLTLTGGGSSFAFNGVGIAVAGESGGSVDTSVISNWWLGVSVSLNGQILISTTDLSNNVLEGIHVHGGRVIGSGITIRNSPGCAVNAFYNSEVELTGTLSNMSGNNKNYCGDGAGGSLPSGAVGNYTPSYIAIQ